MKDKSFDVVGQLPALLRYARALVRDPADAEELVHETLLRAYERRTSFDPRRNLRPWLFSILHNLFIDIYRRRQMEERVVGSMIADPVAAPPPPDADTRVQLAEIHQAFTRLPEAQRAALHLVAVEGLSYQDAADALQIPIGTLMSRVSRARATLRLVDEPPARQPGNAEAENPPTENPQTGAPQAPVQLKLVRGSHGSD